MTISPQWTPEERLLALFHLATRMKALATLTHPDVLGMLYHCAETARQLASQPPTELEARRAQILRDIHGN